METYLLSRYIKPLAVVAVALFVIQGTPTKAAIIPNNLTLVGTVSTVGEYDDAGLGTWNGQPYSPTNRPTPFEDQLSASLNFYVDPAAKNTLYIVANNVADTNYGYISGQPFELVAFTGFQFSLSVPTSHYARFSNEVAINGETLRGPIAGSSVPVTTTPGWNLLAASGSSDDASYSIETPSVADALTHFSSVQGTTRIYGDGAFQLTFDPNVNLFNTDFSTLSASASNGEGAYTETGTLTYAYSSISAVPLPTSFALFGMAVVSLYAGNIMRRRDARIESC